MYDQAMQHAMRMRLVDGNSPSFAVSVTCQKSLLSTCVPFGEAYGKGGTVYLRAQLT